ncbi:MAG: hypothetical protein JWP06_112 [Candidatus Saccharibacteria bacterium]|nr:hypothetical protein [Candidatus Saccharibacteria bacterium]
MAKKQRSTTTNPAKLQKYYNFLADPEQFPVASSTTHSPERSSISREIAREKKLKNDDTEQDIRLKKITLNRLFTFLASETVLIFVFSFFQATHLFGFSLEEWSFKLLTSVTIAQITIMLLVAVQYLFPKNRSS